MAPIVMPVVEFVTLNTLQAVLKDIKPPVLNSDHADVPAFSSKLTELAAVAVAERYDRTAVPALLMPAYESVLPLLITDAEPAAESAVAIAADDVLVSMMLLPNKDTDHTELDIEKLTMLATTYSPADKELVPDVPDDKPME